MKNFLKKLLRPLIFEILKEGNKTDILIGGNVQVEGSLQFGKAK